MIATQRTDARPQHSLLRSTEIQKEANMCLVRTTLVAAMLMALLVGIVNADTTAAEPAAEAPAVQAAVPSAPSADLDRVLKDIIPLSGIVAVFGTIILLTAIPLVLGYRKEVLRHKTIREMVDQHTAVPPELLQDARMPKSDLRRGVTLVAAGLGIGLCCALFRGLAGIEGLWAVGLVPACIGAGHLLVWKLEQKKDNGGA